LVVVAGAVWWEDSCLSQRALCSCIDCGQSYKEHLSSSAVPSGPNQSAHWTWAGHLCVKVM